MSSNLARGRNSPSKSTGGAGGAEGLSALGSRLLGSSSVPPTPPATACSIAAHNGSCSQSSPEACSKRFASEPSCAVGKRPAEKSEELPRPNHGAEGRGRRAVRGRERRAHAMQDDDTHGTVRCARDRAVVTSARGEV